MNHFIVYFSNGIFSNKSSLVEDAHEITQAKWNEIKKSVKAAIRQHLESDEEDDGEQPIIGEEETEDW